MAVHEMDSFSLDQATVSTRTNIADRLSTLVNALPEARKISTESLGDPEHHTPSNQHGENTM